MPRKREKREAVCPVCGKRFTVCRGQRRYCSKPCQSIGTERIKRERESRPGPPRECIICGRRFSPARYGQTTCSPTCKSVFRQWREKHRRDKSNRPFTESTAYLCQKWYREGDSIEKIALALDRSSQNIRQALKVPLTRVQLLTLEANLWPKRR